MTTITAPRLDLVPLTPEFLADSLAGNTASAEKTIGAAIPAEWYEADDLMRLRKQQLELDPSLQPWLLRGLVLRESRQMVGHIGFHTKPGPAYLQPFTAHGVEIGYTVFAAYRRQGYAREACLALMDWAYREHAVNQFVVSISPSNEASLRLAGGLGFEQAGSMTDEEDGLELVFILNYAPAGSVSDRSLPQNPRLDKA